MRVAGFISLLAVLLARVEAAPKALKPHERHTQHHTSTSLSHQTKLGQFAHKGPVPTVTVERSTTIFRTVTMSTTVHSTTTKKLKPVTVTDTAFTTSTAYVTASTNTDVVSVTSTEFNTATVTVTPDPISVTIESDTTTTTTATSTIAATDGFIPIASSFSTQAPLKKRDLEKRSNAIDIKNMQHPQSVTCIKEIIVEIIIIEIFTATPITKTVCVPRVTTHITSAVTTTSTIVPADVSTTVSETVTCTITSATTLPLTTQTVTTTFTVTESSTTSVLGACATNNIAGSPLSSDFGELAGQYVVNAGWGTFPGYTYTTRSGSTPYDCCVACIQDESCGLSYLVNASGVCIMVDTTTCSQSSNHGWMSLSPTDVNFNTFQVSNGNCAVVNMDS
ncbi:hypothetical protein N7474_006264 [Penicillium riverlandense]|uniref:uncharacterized protein n=1 Tax=Penicillium riverlandense TaxID=1903569 RepID=UPI00254781D3|nr:uncharacterized protein N7474_006264 [Penicillium riverlandense]KAJ5814487.1 hypothetical protein N7474_006264 [Penicillium riverlandense]